MVKTKAISVLSGGLDSTVATAYYKEQYEIEAITFNYGQRSSRREIQSAQAICNKLDIKHNIIELPWLQNLGSSALTSSEKIPELGMDELDDKKFCTETARKVWVPGRNIVFTAIATSYAEALVAEKIIVGWDREEATTFPDNSREFLDAFNQLIKIGSIYDVEIVAPLIGRNKEEIVKLGIEVNAPLELSYSCYQGGEEHCGVCESCMRRKRAFINAVITDPVKYMK
jgi:7-cyano-7-deazaguanine synthase